MTFQRTQAQAERAMQDMRDANPVTWLKSVVDKAKLPPPVRAHVNQLFKKHLLFYGIDPESVLPTAKRIAAQINWIRAEYALIMSDPLDAKHFMLSKVALQWAVNMDKSNKTQTVGRSPESDRVEFPNTPDGMDDSEPNDRTAD